jgi:hypothetical protein
LKYLIISGIIAVIFYLFLFWRLRRYLPVARKIFSITRDLYRLTRVSGGSSRGGGGNGPVETDVRSKSTSGEMLVRCASCGTWIPKGRALRLKSATYCSTTCIEKEAAEPQERRRSAQ